MSLERAKWVAAAAAVLAFTAFSGDAHAQAFNVNNFSCSSTPFGVNVDASGLGHTDLCVIGNATIGLDCACAGGGGNCTSDSAKNTTSSSASTSQDLQPKNGSVSATVTIPFATSDRQCTTGTNPLTCPSGQTAKLVEFSASEDFTLCKVVSPNTVCSGPTPSCAQSDVLDTITCTSSGTPFPGKKNSCLALFPS